MSPSAKRLLGAYRLMVGRQRRQQQAWIETRALRAEVPTKAPDAVSGDAQRPHSLDQHGPAAELTGHLTASSPSPDVSTRHQHDEAA